jgi:hypothetical protein
MAGTSGLSLGMVEQAAAASTAALSAPYLTAQEALRSQIRRFIGLTLEPASLAQQIERVRALMSVAAKPCQFHGHTFAKRKPAHRTLGLPSKEKALLRLHDHRAEMNRRAQVRHSGLGLSRARNNATQAGHEA